MTFGKIAKNFWEENEDFRFREFIFGCWGGFGTMWVG